MLIIVSLFASPTAPLVAAQAPPAAKPAAKPAAAPVPAPEEEAWPRAYSTASGAILTIYQPQVASWVDQKHAVLYAAVSYSVKGAKTPAIGTIKVESDTSVALDDRLVSFSEFKITESNFPSLQRDQVKALVSEIDASVPLEERVIALDRVLANVDMSQIVPKNVDGLKADPPPIFFSKAPAVLVNIDGDPIWTPIPQNDLTSAVNTNWDLFEHGPTKTYYLRHEKVWLKATDVKGPWSPAGTLPGSFAKLPADDNWKEVIASLPGAKVSASQAPNVFVSLAPAELILLRGEPSYLAVEGAPQLLWVSNTDSDVFRMGLKGPVYFLVAGRWFSAPDFTGPWTFATPSLPASFKQISLEHERSRVLASVPGTPQAAEAILLAQIPQTARVSKTVAAPEVAYAGGTPQFEPIQPTTVQRAVNTDKDILKVGDLYYMCFQGVWFMSTTATGPWAVTGEVPTQIYEIPVSSPSYNVTHVTVVEDDDDDAVVYATAAAFTGSHDRVGLRGVGHRLLLSPVLWVRGLLPLLLPPLSHLRVRRVVQPLDRGLHSRRRGLRSLRWRRGGRPLQPPNRHILARRRGPRSIRLEGRRVGLQPPHRRLRRNATGLERVRQLGTDRRSARQSVGHDLALHEQRHGRDDAPDRDEWWRHRRQPYGGWRSYDRRSVWERRHICRSRRQRLS